MLITAACSSGSGDPKAKDTGKATPQPAASSAQPSASASPTLQPAVYKKLPDPCSALPKKTLVDLVPKGAKSGKKGKIDDPSSRSSCSWSSLDDNGVKGSQFRWLSVSLLRFESGVVTGSANEQARTFLNQQIDKAESTASDSKSSKQSVSGMGDEAYLVRYHEKRKEGDFKDQKVVVRLENVVVTLDYNGAGLAGDKSPDPDDLSKAAKKAAQDAVSAVLAANGKGTQASSPSTSSATPSQTASKSPSPSASASASATKKG
ncbi:DUF3558 domain-containing protein [Streptomyces pluripotens]|uniref:DUF3558 domain-containing protein n=1 Tax=Streptomyces pluripotens TaxID=1355015 RepID=A0A221P8W0_9ACTN|nr:DUF3558 domain-containing protein [Streptomyces pluripotens]ASN28418.1 DUF3558 domain-containing protein [Streptomyces pluripotens]KIE27460.1 membrane protein [Streptomyces sp. MUSC 125]